jgi:hypothetical protein
VVIDRGHRENCRFAPTSWARTCPAEGSDRREAPGDRRRGFGRHQGDGRLSVSGCRRASPLAPNLVRHPGRQRHPDPTRGRHGAPAPAAVSASPLAIYLGRIRVEQSSHNVS